MAIHDHQVVLTSRLTIGSATLTLEGQSATLTHSVDLADDTVWGDTYKQRLVALMDYQLSFEALNDYTDNELDEDLDALMGTNVATAYSPSSGAISVTNPEYQFTGAVSSLVKTYSLGQVAKVGGTVMLTTSAGVTRDVTP